MIPELVVRKNLVLANYHKLVRCGESKNEPDLSNSKNIYLLSGACGWNIERYGDYRWETEEVDLSEAGLWPGMKGLSEEITQGTVADSARIVAEESFIDERFKKRLSEIAPHLEFLLDNFPPILLPGHTVRKRDPYAIECAYDVWDGNTRCLSAAVQGRESIRAFVGTKT